MALEFKKATKEQSKLRLAIFGPSGSGKTYSGLRLATGMGGKIAVIDTERGRAAKYGDRFDFDVLDLEKRTIDMYCQAIRLAQHEGYSILIIDSLTHAWKELLDEVDQLARAKYGGNRWSAWSDGTPKQMMFIDELLHFDGHVIATMRSKTEWEVQRGEDGKVKPVRIGLAPEQGKGIEYEFDLLMELTVEHTANVIKDITGKFQDRIIECPDEEFGQELIDWLREGAPASPRLNRRDKLINRLNELTGEINGKVKAKKDKINLDETWLIEATEPELIAEGQRLAGIAKDLNGNEATTEQATMPLETEAA